MASLTQPLSPTQAKLRSDLVFSQQQTEGRPFHVIKDPLRRKFYRFSEAEHFIARQLDGSTSLDVIRERTEKRFEASLEPETLENFVETLRRYELLEPPEGELERPVGGRKRVRGSLLYLRFKVFDPDRLLGRLVGKIRFFFTPQFVVLSAAVIGIGFLIAIANWNGVREDLARLYSLKGLLLAGLSIVLVGTAHEFAHGFTCKHFGGEVHEVGLVLLYFQPGLYCNVSEAWLFPEKYKRLWVSIAGAYFELFVWAVATLVWRATETDTRLNFLALVVMATSGIKTLFNLNPLLKLDGYYFLSDYLEIPNLRRRSFSYIGATIKRLLGFGQDGVGEETPQARRIYITYGLIASAFSLWFLGAFVFKAGGALMGQYQGLGLGLLALLFAPKLRRKFGRLFAGASPDSKSGVDASAKAKSSGGMIASLKRPAWAKITALVAGVIVLFLGRLELTVPGDATVAAIRSADARTAVEGIIEEICVDEGDLVHEGDPIARLADLDYSSQLRKAEAEIQQKAAKLKMLEAGETQEQIELSRKEVETAETKWEQTQKRYAEAQQLKAQRLAKARIAVKKAEDRLKYARRNLDRFRKFWEENLFSRKELEAAEEEAAVREKELEEAKAELKLVLADDLAEARKEQAVAEKELAQSKGKLAVVLAGSRREEIEAMKAEIALSEAQRRYLEEQISHLRVVSPITGVVTTPNRQLREMVGQLVKKGDVVAEVHELTTVRAETPISERDIADVKVGQKVAVKFRSYPQQTFYGTVTSVAAAAQSSSSGQLASSAGSPQSGSAAGGDRTLLVTTVIDNSSRLLKPEMTGKVKIFCGKRSIFNLMRRRLARTLKVEFWSWW